MRTFHEVIKLTPQADKRMVGIKKEILTHGPNPRWERYNNVVLGNPMYQCVILVMVNTLKNIVCLEQDFNRRDNLKGIMKYG